jgi:SAM-dependent methyltransferase
MSDFVMKDILNNLNGILLKNKDTKTNVETEFRTQIPFSIYRKLQLLLNSNDVNYIKSNVISYNMPLPNTTRYIYMKNFDNQNTNTHFFIKKETKDQVYCKNVIINEIEFKLSISYEKESECKIFPFIPDEQLVIKLNNEMPFKNKNNIFEISKIISDDEYTRPIPRNTEILFLSDFIIPMYGYNYDDFDELLNNISKNLGNNGKLIIQQIKRDKQPTYTGEILKYLLYSYGFVYRNGYESDIRKIDFFVKTLNIPQYDKYIFRRQKKTTTFIYNDYIIDLSMVVDNRKIGDISKFKPYYELEIEFINNPKDITSLCAPINFITSILKTESNKHNIFSKYILKENKPIGISYDNINILFDKNNKFAVTNKLNGIRYYLVYDKKLFLLNHNNSISISITTPQKSLLKTILDGEFFNNIYYVFDIIEYNGKSCVNYDFLERQNLLNSSIKMINRENPSIKIIQKKHFFKNPNIINNIIDSYEYMSSQFTSYENDGLIFTPINNKNYFSPIYKFKYNPKNITIDFFIKKNLKCMIYNESKFKFIQYENHMAKCNFNNSETINGGLVCECSYNNLLNEWNIERIRNDKIYPNHISVAISTFQNIKNPILLNYINLYNPEPHETLRLYHNYIKRDLINRYRNKSVLDLGSGSGGDILKYINSGYTDIVLVEPNIIRVNESISRLSNINYDKNYISINVINDFAENVNIVDKKFDVITSFFVMSFFFDSNNHIDKLIENIKKHIKKDGVFIGTMISNAGKTDEYKNKKYDDNLYFSDYEKTNKNTKYKIFMNGHLNQEEYESDYKVFAEKMKSEGFIELEYNRFEPRDYLTDNQNNFSNLYMKFGFKFIGKNIFHFTKNINGFNFENDQIMYNIDVINRLKKIKEDDLYCGVAREIITKFGEYFGIENFVVNHIITNNLSFYKINELDMIDKNDIKTKCYNMFMELLYKNENVNDVNDNNTYKLIYNQFSHLIHSNVKLINYNSEKIYYEYAISPEYETTYIITF